MCVSAESTSVLNRVLVDFWCLCVWMCVGGGLGGLQVCSAFLSLALSASVGLWFAQCNSNTTAWHPEEKTGPLPRNTDWTLTECLIWQRRWRLSNHRKKEKGTALYSPTTAAHATGKTRESKIIPKISGKDFWNVLFFYVLHTRLCNVSVLDIHSILII